MSTGGFQSLRMERFGERAKENKRKKSEKWEEEQGSMMSWKSVKKMIQRRKDQLSKADGSSKIRMDYSPWILVR